MQENITCNLTGTDDRRDEDIVALGEEAARIFDEIVIRHDEDMRGRTHQEVTVLLRKGIHAVDRNKSVMCYEQECEAVEKILKKEKKGTVIVVLVDNVAAITECVLRLQQKAQAQAMSRQPTV